jgi:putative endonuclease
MQIGIKVGQPSHLNTQFFIMHYIYLIRSKINSEKTYIGYTTDVNERLEKHNSGGSVHTANFRPWQLISYIAFDTKEKALSFEQYLKVGSGHAFAQKRFW